MFALRMRFYNQPHRFYCGVDLHARRMYLCILDHGGAIVLQTSDDDLLDNCWLPVRRAKSTN
jgi:hypothetical protein